MLKCVQVFREHICWINFLTRYMEMYLFTVWASGKKGPGFRLYAWMMHTGFRFILLPKT